MFGRGICEKYQSRDEKFPEPKDISCLGGVFAKNTSRETNNLVSRLEFFANTPPKHDISV